MSTPDIAEFVENHGVDLSWVDSFYTWMHENPELSEQEEQTAAHIQSRLAQLDCEVTTGIGGHGITAVWRNGDGPTVLYRADFDALPVTEDTGASYASKNVGVMHACGHDVHTSALIGLCEIMDTRRDVSVRHLHRPVPAGRGGHPRCRHDDPGRSGRQDPRPTGLPRPTHHARAGRHRVLRARAGDGRL